MKFDIRKLHIYLGVVAAFFFAAGVMYFVTTDASPSTMGIFLVNIALLISIFNLLIGHAKNHS